MKFTFDIRTWDNDFIRTSAGQSMFQWFLDGMPGPSRLEEFRAYIISIEHQAQELDDDEVPA